MTSQDSPRIAAERIASALLASGLPPSDVVRLIECEFGTDRPAAADIVLHAAQPRLGPATCCA